MKVYNINDTIKLKNSEKKCKAHIHKISISSDGVQYFVSWWNGTNRTEAWIYESEIEPYADTVQTTIGFMSHEN